MSSYVSHKFTDPYNLAIFTTDLRVITSYYKLFTVYYGLLRCSYGKIPRFVTSCHGQLQATCKHFTSFLQIVTSILRNVTIHQSFYVLFTTCLHVVTNSYELVMSIYKSLRFFAKNYSSCSCTIVQGITSED